MTTKVNDVVGLGSHDDSKQPSSLTSSSSGVPTSVRNSSSSTGASEQSTLSPDTAQASSARSSGWVPLDADASSVIVKLTLLNQTQAV
jgi:hypothetical protein